VLSELSQNDLKMGIKSLLDLVSYEHQNIEIVKYFLKIVSFAKNLVNPID